MFNFMASCYLETNLCGNKSFSSYTLLPPTSFLASPHNRKSCFGHRPAKISTTPKNVCPWIIHLLFMTRPANLCQSIFTAHLRHSARSIAFGTSNISASGFPFRFRFARSQLRLTTRPQMGNGIQATCSCGSPGNAISRMIQNYPCSLS